MLGVTQGVSKTTRHRDKGAVVDVIRNIAGWCCTAFDIDVRACRMPLVLARPCLYNHNSNCLCSAGSDVVRQAQAIDSLNTAVEFKEAREWLQKGNFKGESKRNRVQRGINAGFGEQLESIASSDVFKQ